MFWGGLKISSPLESFSISTAVTRGMYGSIVENNKNVLNAYSSNIF